MQTLHSLVEICEHFWFLSMIKLKRNLRLLPALHLFQFKEDSAIFPVHKNINRHDDYCQPLMTYAASIQLTSEVFPGKRVVLEPSLHFNPGLQSSVRILPYVYILPPVCSLRFTLTAPLWFSRLDHQLTDSCLCFVHLMAASRLHPIALILITIFKPLSSNEDHQKTNFLSS